MVNLYQSEVGKLSDGELRVLSEELSEEYCCNGEDESYWTDDAAETRYHQLRGEINRRWEIANPDEADRRRNFYGPTVRAIMESMQNQFAFNREFVRQFKAEPAKQKIGDTLTVRMPTRFHG